MESKFKFPTIGQLKKIPSVLSIKEKIAIIALLLIPIGLFVWKNMETYIETTKLVPIRGGAYIEGVVGLPRYINPVISQANDVDETITKLLFSSLFRYDSQGKLVNDLVAGQPKISDDGKSYEISLRQDARWHDGKSLTADDVIYTASVIKDPNYKSSLRINLEGMTFEKIDDYNLIMKTKNSFGQALSVLTFGILPKHEWEKVSPENFTLAMLNIKPIGSGFYRFENFAKDKTGKILYYQLITNNDYYGEKPYLENVVFKFYSSPADAIDAYNNKEIAAIGGISQDREKDLNKDLGTLYKINIPQYFAVFFNQNKSKPLSDKIVRTALAYSVDKQNLINEVLAGNAIILEGPYLPYLPGYNSNTNVYDFAIDHAKNILDGQGWKDGNSDSVLEKDGINLEFTLLTGDDPDLAASANSISQMWAKIGAKVVVKVVPVNELTNNYIRSRDYDAILFGEVLSLDPNPFVFWHSSERKDPGLNLAVYSNKDVDKILEDAELIIDPSARAEKYKDFQRLVIEDVPAVFLYSPFYFYGINNEIKGVDIRILTLPTERLNDVNKWYTKTGRMPK